MAEDPDLALLRAEAPHARIEACWRLEGRITGARVGARSRRPPETAEARAQLREAAIVALAPLVDDDGVWSGQGPANFDGDRLESHLHVAAIAVRTLAAIAPERAPIDRIAAALVRLDGRLAERHHTNFSAPIEAPLRWPPALLRAFGPPLERALADLAEGSPDERTRQVAARLLEAARRGR
ncbi:MAG: hypothetical protein R3B09_02495 [Nannocystaceae bacterium]